MFLRILSLLPAATEIVYLLGLEKYLVGVSHECDWPPEVKIKPKVTSSDISNSMNSREIDERVKNSLHKGPGVFHIKKNMLKLLKPNLIITQELCKACAIAFTDVQKAARILELRSMNYESRLEIVSLEPESVNDILDNILLVGEKTGISQRSKIVVNTLKKRLKTLNSRFIIHNSKKPKVLIIEWLDPIMVAGHWVPEMVELAGGESTLSTLSPDILIIAPCGFDIQRTIQEKQFIQNVLDREYNGNVRVYLVDGNAYMTRPGPRIIDGIEILSEILYPEIFPRKHTKNDWRELSL